jgi:hypothetical protein
LVHHSDETQNSLPALIFASYSHQDETLHDELAKHLKPLEREGMIRPWHDRRITAGKEFAAVIDAELNRADIILLLVSPDFVASEYCWGKEMLRAMERHDAGEAVVVPIILRPIDWHKTPFGKLLALPKDGKPITTWLNRDDAFLNVAQGIRDVVSHLPRQDQKRATPDVTLRSVAHTTDYCATVVEVDIRNPTSESDQITRSSIEIPSLGIILEHAPGPPNLHFGAPWLERVPITIAAKKLTRGCLYFPGGDELRGGLPSEPLNAKLKLEFFIGAPVEREIEIYTLDTLQNMKENPRLTSAKPPSPAAKLKSAFDRREAEREKQQQTLHRQAERENAALATAPKEFEALAETLRSKGEALNEEHIRGMPILKFEPVNHRLDAGSTYSIEVSPYAQMRSCTVTVRIGLHPNAHQSHAELPKVRTVAQEFRADVEDGEFSWRDNEGRKWKAEEITDFALDKLIDLLTSEHEY